MIDIWLNLQATYNEILKEKGDNMYSTRIPSHVNNNIQKLMKEGKLSLIMTICPDALTIMKDHTEECGTNSR